MKFVFYTHSLLSDWNHGNAHFLRGVMRDLVSRGHEALALEPGDAWSRQNLLNEQGEAGTRSFRRAYPELRTVIYGTGFDHAAVLADADVVVVHEWNHPALVADVGRLRRKHDFLLFFHDTHHRAVSASREIAALRLDDFDGVLAFGETLSEEYRRAGWGERVFTWHEAADDTVFKPLDDVTKTGDLVWVGNWGDDERSSEIREFLVRPVQRTGIAATIHGVRYPPDALRRLSEAGIAFGGWIANADVPAVFARHRLTVHIPRRPYVESLPGIPTIRVFEALACGIPLISAPWQDSENLFRPGEDFLVARNGSEMARLVRAVLSEDDLRRSLVRNGLEAIRQRHTCRHRVDELLAIVATCGGATAGHLLA